MISSPVLSVAKNSLEYDISTAGVPSTYFLLCSMPRCGSTMLSDDLSNSGMFGFPHEYYTTLHLNDYKKRFNTNSTSEVFKKLKKVRTTPNGVFSLNIHYQHFENLVKEVDVEALFPQANLIILERRDVIAQAVSWAFSLKTAAWSSEEDIVTTPEYDESFITNCLYKIMKGYAGWKLYAAALKRKNPQLIVKNYFFEDIIVDRELALASILNLVEGNPSKKTRKIISESILKNKNKPHGHPIKKEWLANFSRKFENPNFLHVSTLLQF